MEFEWDEAKSARVKRERGASFEELAFAIHDGAVLDFLDHPTQPEQSFFVVLFKGEVWAVVTEERGSRVRLVTAYQNRKWRKKYGI